METEVKAERTWLAVTPTFPGYWGKHADGPHHAIVECLGGGAKRGGLFVVYEGNASLRCNELNGGLVWDGDPADEPRQEGVFTAAGAWLGDSLAEVAGDLRKGYLLPDEHGLDRETVAALKAHKAEAA